MFHDKDRTQGLAQQALGGIPQQPVAHETRVARAHDQQIYIQKIRLRDDGIQHRSFHQMATGAHAMRLADVGGQLRQRLARLCPDASLQRLALFAE